ncbi:Mov34/MPN/PAD-1 family protein [Mastigocladopsis repens]|uniref:Mov34/MPN/PAD-1 family protein n=1 Tax=Mastigocladopsis repens TaxID=221287 RepID=UPI0003115570|nr:M67 family metallopeptidase [Mastigocladopsis repens]
MILKLLPEHLQTICTHAETTYPEECCGIILGYLASEGKTVVKVMPTENAWSAETAADFPRDDTLDYSKRQRYAIVRFLPRRFFQKRLPRSEGTGQLHGVQLGKRTRFAIAPQVMLQAQKEARDCKLNIIGIYHSHTDHPAIPSECDRQLAWQEYSYIIVSVQKGKASDIKSWLLDDNHQFQQEAIEKLG